MAFPTGWGYKQKLTIQNSLVSATLTDFPVLITRTELHNDIADPSGSNNAQANGGDIRFSTDSAGSNQLACEIVSFEHDTTTGAGDAVVEVHIKVPSVSSSVDTDFYIWYNTTGADTQPAVTDTYGRNAVWSDYAIVNHLTDGADSTGNESDLTLSGTAAYTGTGKLPGVALDVASSDYAYINNIAATLSTTESVSAQYWVNRDADNTSGDYDEVHLLNRNGDGWIIGPDAGQILSIFTVGSNTASRSGGTALNLSAWRQCHVIWNQSGATVDHYVDGSLDGSQVTSYGDTSSYTTGTAEWELGKDSGAGTGLDGKLDEVRYRKSALSSGWVATEYNSQNSPSTFIVESAPVAAAGGTTPPWYYYAQH